MKLPTPVFDRVIVKPHMEPEMSKGGIVIPDSVRKKATFGEVVAAGPGKPMTPHEVGPRGPQMATDYGNFPVRPMVIKVGDIVHYGEYVGQQLRVDGITYIVIQETDVLGFERPSVE